MGIELCTKREKGDYERIVDLYVSKSKNDIPYINDADTCKLLLLKKGTLVLNGLSLDQLRISSPAVIFLSNQDKIEITTNSRFDATTVFFKPSVVNDAFQYDCIYQSKFEEMCGTSLYQDYIIIRDFVMKDGKVLKYSPLTENALAYIVELISKMEYELREQYDDYWPCRSRSFFLEILFYLNYNYNADNTDSYEHSFCEEVMEYLKNHIDEKITLEMLTSQFHVSRNYLNKMFLEETGVTCLAYLLKLRMDLAKLWLSETEIPVSEIGRRLGYVDQNYFSKVFRRECGVSPTHYRYSDVVEEVN